MDDKSKQTLAKYLASKQDTFGEASERNYRTKYPAGSAVDNVSKSLYGQGKFRDTGRESSGYAESIDSLIGAPARTLADEFAKGNISIKALEAVVKQIGADPELAPHGEDIISKLTDDRTTQEILGRALDMGLQLPGTEFITPGVIGEIRGVKHLGKVADAVEAFANRAKEPISTETKIAQMHGTAGEVKDAVPALIEKTKSELGVDTPKNDHGLTLRVKNENEYTGQRDVDVLQNGKWIGTRSGTRASDKSIIDDFSNAEGQRDGAKTKFPKGNSPEELFDSGSFWHDPNDHSFSDEAKKSLDSLRARHGEKDADVLEGLRLSHHGPDHKPYTGIGEQSFDKHLLPNYNAKPTGTIGVPTIQDASQPRSLDNDPFPLMDDKYKAGKTLLQKHKSLGMPAEIHTSSDLIGKSDYIEAIPKGSTVNFHLMSPDDTLNRIVFPGNPSNGRLLDAAEKIKNAGIKVNVHEPTVEKFIDSANNAGADRLRNAGLSGDQKETVDALRRKGMLTEEEKASNVTPMSSIYKKPPQKPEGYAHGGAIQGGHLAVPHGVDPFQGHPQSTEPAGLDAYLGMHNQTMSSEPPGLDQYLSADMNEERYGGTTGELKAFGLGALRGATLGGSDWAATASGAMTPEELKGYKDTDPFASGTGEFGGAVGSMFLAPEFAPVALIGKAGKAVAGGVKALKVARLAEEGTAAAKVLGAAGDIASTAAGSAVEGALYSGIGNTITEHSLGDPELLGQKILSNFGYGAVMGGALGGVLKTAEIGIPESLKAAKEHLASLKNMLIGTGEAAPGVEDKIAGGLLGSTLRAVDTEGSIKLAQALENRATNLDLDARTGLVKSVTKTLNSVYRNIETSIKKLNDTIRPAERDVLIDTAASPQKLAEARQTVINQMNRALDTAAERPALYDPGPIAKLEQIRDDFVGQLAENQTPAKIHAGLVEAKQQLQGLAYTKTSSTAKDTKALIDDVWGGIREVVHNPDIFGHAGASQAAHDAFLTDHYQFSPPNNKLTPFRKAFMEKTGDGKWAVSAAKVETALKQKGTPRGDAKLDLLDQWFEHLHKIPEHLENTFANVPNGLWDENKFAKMSGILGRADMSVQQSSEKYLEAVQNMKGRRLGMGDMLAGTIATAHPVLGAAVEAYNIATQPLEYINKLAEVERLVGKATNAIGKGAKSVFESSVRTVDPVKNVLGKFLGTEDHAELADKISEYQNNPSLLVSHLSSATERLHEVAPGTAASIQMASARAANFLASKLPIRPPPNPFGDKYKASESEIAKFERYAIIVDRPMHAFAQVARGTVTKETVETLQIVYPKLYDQMRTALISEATKLASKKEKIPFQKKQSISFFLGEPLEASLQPQNVQANQAMFVQAQNQLPPGAKAKAEGNITLGKRTGLNRGQMDA